MGLDVKSVIPLENQNIIDAELNNFNDRISSSFGDLIGETFEKGDKINLKYKSPDGNVISYIFDTNNNKVIINDRIFTIKHLEGFSIDRVEFTDNKIIIYGIMGIIDGKLEATYKKTLISIDEIYNYINNNN